MEMIVSKGVADLKTVKQPCQAALRLHSCKIFPCPSQLSFFFLSIILSRGSTYPYRKSMSMIPIYSRATEIEPQCLSNPNCLIPAGSAGRIVAVVVRFWLTTSYFPSNFYNIPFCLTLTSPPITLIALCLTAAKASLSLPSTNILLSHPTHILALSLFFNQGKLDNNNISYFSSPPLPSPLPKLNSHSQQEPRHSNFKK